MTRVAVYIDYQNVYKSARRCFGHDEQSLPGCHGQFNPQRLGLLAVERGRIVDPARELEFVKVFRGEPSAVQTRTGQAAAQRQHERWRSLNRVSVLTRPLAGTPPHSIREKGIDVLMALGIALDARDDLYDVAVVCSRDTDLIPALAEAQRAGKRVEVQAWRGSSNRLNVPGSRVHCHWFNQHDYDGFLADLVDYTSRRRT